MKQNSMLAMILAGGRGSRLHELTNKVAKPAVGYGGKYRIVDFPLSNCANSGIDVVGVLTQYESVLLNSYVAAGGRWGLDAKDSGVYVLPPREKADAGLDVYRGTADAISQNIDFIDSQNPEYLLILSGDHIYKMNYAKMLDDHIQHKADATIAVIEVPMKEASRFGIMNTGEDDRIVEFEEKPEHPKSNLASMGIYIFSWPVLKEALIKLRDQKGCDFGKHVLPYCHEKGDRIFAYEFNGYWKDVGTLGSYWESNMELIDLIPVFNLYEEFWKIYTRNEWLRPQYIAKNALIDKAIMGDGCEVYGEVHNSVIGSDVVIEEGAIVRDSIIMNNSVIGKNTIVNKSIIAEEVVIGDNVELGVGEEAPNVKFPKIYNSGLVTIGECSVIPDGVKIGKNTAISGVTSAEDYPDGLLPSGGIIIKAGEVE